jgi:hypothetical protein
LILVFASSRYGVTATEPGGMLRITNRYLIPTSSLSIHVEPVGFCGQGQAGLSPGCPAVLHATKHEISSLAEEEQVTILPWPRFCPAHSLLRLKPGAWSSLYIYLNPDSVLRWFYYVGHVVCSRANLSLTRVHI